jgi:hypothetical protein
MTRKTLTPLERLERYSERSDGCWNWVGAGTNPGGWTTQYGALRVNGKNISAHRLAYELYVGPIPPGMFVCHHCDNKRCVRPDHLFLGTAKDNAQDYVRKYGSFYWRQYPTWSGDPKEDP